MIPLIEKKRTYFVLRIQGVGVFLFYFLCDELGLALELKLETYFYRVQVYSGNG